MKPRNGSGLFDDEFGREDRSNVFSRLLDELRSGLIPSKLTEVSLTGIFGAMTVCGGGLL
jgi:hypothetical protein